MNRRTFLSRSSRVFAAGALSPALIADHRVSGYNTRRSLSFSNNWIESVIVSTLRDMPVEEAIVVNLSAAKLEYRVGEDHGSILPWKSTKLRHCTIESGETVALLHVRQRTNLGSLALRWPWYGRQNPEFSRDTPLYISSQDEIGDVRLDPLSAFTHERVASASPRRYTVKLNLWYTPEDTDCGIHTGHQFLEVHTQIFGNGHMQKFRENNSESLYEDVPMSPGFTHEPFFTVRSDRSFSYPWHRYYAETDCIWMAIELHPS
jgi:hypothetical protein